MRTFTFAPALASGAKVSASKPGLLLTSRRQRTAFFTVTPILIPLQGSPSFYPEMAHADLGLSLITALPPASPWLYTSSPAAVLLSLSKRSLSNCRRAPALLSTFVFLEGIACARAFFVFDFLLSEVLACFLFLAAFLPFFADSFLSDLPAEPAPRVVPCLKSARLSSCAKRSFNSIFNCTISLAILFKSIFD